MYVTKIILFLQKALVRSLLERKVLNIVTYVPNVVENSKYFIIGQIKIWDDYYPNLIISKTKI